MGIYLFELFIGLHEGLVSDDFCLGVVTYTIFVTGVQQPTGVWIKSCSAPEEINSSDLNKLLGKSLKGH